MGVTEQLPPIEEAGHSKPLAETPPSTPQEVDELQVDRQRASDGIKCSLTPNDTVPGVKLA